MLLKTSSPDFYKPESEIANWLSTVSEQGSAEPSEDVRRTCRSLGSVLVSVFQSLERKHHWRRWEPDELSCEHVSRTGPVVTLRGSASWLVGGGTCKSFQIDVTLDTQPLLYSYKFIHAKKGKQVLYVGRTPDGWLLNGA